PRRNLGLALDLGGGGTVALLDGYGWAAFGEIEYRFVPAASIAAGVLWLPTDVYDAPPGEIALRVIAGSLRGCGFFLRGQATDSTWPPRVGACGVAALGSLRGVGNGFSEANRATSVLWATVGGAAIVEQPIADFPILGPLAATGRLGVLFPVLRQSFS